MPLVASLQKIREFCDRFFPEQAPVAVPEKDRALTFFLLTLILYAVYLVLLQSQWVMAGEMWAEMATNYFPNARSGKLMQQLFATDAGYIPLPQRLIALSGAGLNAGSSAFFYTWASILATAMLAATFCLAPFRSVLRSDGLRFSMAIAVLVVADFEARNFISFTYFVTFFAAILTALAFTARSRDVPVYAWLLPVLMMSKPAVMSALPAMAFVALVSAPRFRRIFIVTLAVCLLQLLQIIISQKNGTMPLQASDITLAAKLYATAKYTLGLLTGFLTGPWISTGIFRHAPRLTFLAGLALAGMLLALIIRRRQPANILIVIGLSLLFSNVLLNCFAMSKNWNTDMAILSSAPVSRHIIAGFFGSLLIVGCLAQQAGQLRPRTEKLPLLLFAAWFVFSGWLYYGLKISRNPSAPVIHNSQWHEMADRIDADPAVLCIPLDPFGWMYGKNCHSLDPGMDWGHGFAYKAVERNADGKFVLDIPVHAALSGQRLFALSALLRPESGKAEMLGMKALITSVDGETLIMSRRRIRADGGLITFQTESEAGLQNITHVQLIADQPFAMAYAVDISSSPPAIIWMGNPSPAQP